MSNQPAIVTPPAGGRATAAGTARRRLLADRAARWLVVGGGATIVLSILGILFFIVWEVAPLAMPARVQPVGVVPLPPPVAGALLADEHRSHLMTLGGDGRLRVVRLADGAVVLDMPVDADRPGATTRVAPVPGQNALIATTGAGEVLVAAARWDVAFDGGVRRTTPLPPMVERLRLDPEGGPLGAFAAALTAEGRAAAAAQLADGSLVVLRPVSREDLLTGEVIEDLSRSGTPALPYRLTLLVLDRAAANLFAATAEGDLLWWRLAGGVPEPPEKVDLRPARATALCPLIGGGALAVGRSDGGVGIWFPVRGADGGVRMQKVREFSLGNSPIRQLAPSWRDKGLLALAEDGRLALLYSTSGRVLWMGEAPIPDGGALHFAPKADAAYLAGPGGVAALEIRNPHPQVGWKALFGRVWYEGYPEPDLVWQSSGGSDDFEPKLSMVPLLVGTLKGTAYSLLLAIPLGVLGAMFTSQFLHPSLRRVVKPTVEIMAALPSVVLGFLAGLWLAPRLEQTFPAVLLMAVVLPLSILGTGLGWRQIPRRIRGRLPMGIEVFLFAAVLAGGIAACVALSRPVEGLLFAGDFPAWLLEITGLRYDQRNAVVVGIAMGFAVIPVIFSISEDAFSNVPATLTSASLALGATRWQTVTRVVLPTASPGIFSAVMVGFGRAVGETMIVLMATGNTPLMDWNPFNGFRTLSANLAVEIPEAPVGGTLYRTLFLAALMLFLLTFAVNTLAELVRQRLRRRYAHL